MEALAALSVAAPGALWGGTGPGETEAPGARCALVRAGKKRARSCSAPVDSGGDPPRPPPARLTRRYNPGGALVLDSLRSLGSLHSPGGPRVVRPTAGAHKCTENTDE